MTVLKFCQLARTTYWYTQRANQVHSGRKSLYSPIKLDSWRFRCLTKLYNISVGQIERRFVIKIKCLLSTIYFVTISIKSPFLQFRSGFGCLRDLRNVFNFWEGNIRSKWSFYSWRISNRISWFNLLDCLFKQLLCWRGLSLSLILIYFKWEAYFLAVLDIWSK